MDTIFITDLRIETRIGVYEWEKHVRQPVLLNIEIAMPHSRAGATDELADALDYAAVVERLKGFLTDHPHELLERLAEEIAALILREFSAPWVRVQLAKMLRRREAFRYTSAREVWADLRELPAWKQRQLFPAR